MEKKYLYLLISILLLFSYYSIISFNCAINYYVKMEKENFDFKKDISAIGGLGLSITDLEKSNAIELTDKYQNKFGLNNFGWTYIEIGYPVDPNTSYITSQYGIRYINGKKEDHKSIDIKQKYSLKVKSSINGICRINYNKSYGYNVTIKNFIIMKNALGKKQICKVKIRLSHLSRIDVKDGQWIKKDEIVGLMGNSGRCAIYDEKLKIWREITVNERNMGIGVHLDFELEINGYKRNPFYTSINQIVKL